MELSFHSHLNSNVIATKLCTWRDSDLIANNGIRLQQGEISTDFELRAKTR